MEEMWVEVHKLKGIEPAIVQQNGNHSNIEEASTKDIDGHDGPSPHDTQEVDHQDLSTLIGEDLGESSMQAEKEDENEGGNI